MELPSVGITKFVLTIFIKKVSYIYENLYFGFTSKIYCLSLNFQSVFNQGLQTKQCQGFNKKQQKWDLPSMALES